MTTILFEAETGRRPRTTVIVSLYNYRAYIEACLDSVAAQRVEHLDLVIVDDASTDESSAVALGWMKAHSGRFGRAVLARHDLNQGLAVTRNSAIALTRSEFIQVLDADNLLLPHCVGELEGALDRTTAAFAYGYHRLLGDETGITNTAPWGTDFASGNVVDAMALIRRDVLQRVGGYSTMPVMGWEDFDLWFKVARAGEWGVMVPTIVATYRVHAKSMLQTVTNFNIPHLWRHLRDTYPEFFDTQGARPMFDPFRAGANLRAEGMRTAG